MHVYPSDLDKRCANIAARWGIGYTFDVGNASQGISHFICFKSDGIWSQSFSSRSLKELYKMLDSFDSGFTLAARIAEKRTDSDIF